MKKVLAIVLCLMMVLVLGVSAKEISEVKIGYILKPDPTVLVSMKGRLAWATEKASRSTVCR